MPLSPQLLKASLSFLSQAHILLSAISGLFWGAGDPDASTRLNDISNRIADERDLIERQIHKNGAS